MPPAFSASRAGVMPEASRDRSLGTSGKNTVIATTLRHEYSFTATMTAPQLNDGNSPLAGFCLLGMALLFIGIGVFTDPIGPDPDSGIIDLGTNGTKILLIGFGISFLLGGLWAIFHRR